jgi:transcription antitermination factor NusG
LQLTKYWYALHSHPNKEDLLWQQLMAREVEVFYPRIPANPVNPRARKIKPYFPGYLFVNADVEQSGLSFFQWMPYATGLVMFGGEPAVVPEALIYTVRQRVEEITRAGGEVLNEVKPGDRVEIQDGPFAGYNAIFDVRLPGKERVRVLLQMLTRRTVPLELSSGQIKKLKPR